MYKPFDQNNFVLFLILIEEYLHIHAIVLFDSIESHDIEFGYFSKLDSSKIKKDSTKRKFVRKLFL